MIDEGRDADAEIGGVGVLGTQGDGVDAVLKHVTTFEEQIVGALGKGLALASKVSEVFEVMRQQGEARIAHGSSHALEGVGMTKHGVKAGPGRGGVYRGEYVVGWLGTLFEFDHLIGYLREALAGFVNEQPSVFVAVHRHQTQTLAGCRDRAGSTGRQAPKIVEKNAEEKARSKERSKETEQGNGARKRSKETEQGTEKRRSAHVPSAVHRIQGEFFQGEHAAPTAPQARTL